jgi:hypothetical protein
MVGREQLLLFQVLLQHTLVAVVVQATQAH